MLGQLDGFQGRLLRGVEGSPPGLDTRNQHLYQGASESGDMRRVIAPTAFNTRGKLPSLGILPGVGGSPRFMVLHESERLRRERTLAGSRQQPPCPR
jgi:hypothetical protein